MELLSGMGQLVTDYGELGRTGSTIGALISGTSFFPGGAGLWRGETPKGPLPEYFPDRPIMLIAHNFDSQRSYEKSLRRGAESLRYGFWKHLRAYLFRAKIPLEQCFFTNALMGLQPLSATGPMKASDLFREQCRVFLRRQVEIVRPTCIAVLGNDAWNEVRRVPFNLTSSRCLHPTALIYKKVELHDRIVAEQAEVLATLWQSRKRSTSSIGGPSGGVA